MSHKRPPIPVILIVLTVIAVSVYFIIQQQAETGNGVLTASGTIEAVDVTVSAEMAGKVIEVYVDEGDPVQVGDQLLRLDDSLLQAQRQVAEAALESARAAEVTAQAALVSAQVQFDLAVLVAQAEEQSLRTNGWMLPLPSAFDQPNWYFNRDEQIMAAEAELITSEEALLAAQERLKLLEVRTTSEDFLQAEQKLAQERLAYQVAQDVLDRTSGVSGQELRDSAQTAFDEAEANLDDAQEAYDDILTTESAQDVLDARADVTIAQERLDTIRDRLRILQIGIYSPKLQAAESTVAQAEAAANQAGQVIQQAQAQLDLIDTQLEKLSIYSPIDGIVMTRYIQPGEIIQPGAAAITIAQLDDLTLTVYVPENRYGEIVLEQTVDVTVDSFPGTTFMATVIQIADRAEFTPRNVQTVEGRSSTVYAIKLSIDDPEGKLKPGMPADVSFR